MHMYDQILITLCCNFLSTGQKKYLIAMANNMYLTNPRDLDKDNSLSCEKNKMVQYQI